MKRKINKIKSTLHNSLLFVIARLPMKFGINSSRGIYLKDCFAKPALSEVEWARNDELRSTGKTKSILIGLVFVILLISNAPTKVQAASASFYLSPSSGAVKVGDNITASVMISADTPINAGEGSVMFSDDTLKFVSVSGSGSIFSFWTNGPSGGDNSVVFGGGLPSPGYEGGGKVVTIIWKAKAVGTGTVSIIGSKILANDGVGTNILSGSGGGSFNITENVAAFSIKTSSSSHPDQEKWYSNNNVAMNWSAAGASGYFIAFDQSESSNPTEQTNVTSKSYDGKADGIWYFHAKAKKDAEMTSVGHFRVHVDITPPEEFVINVSREFGLFDLSPKVTFEAKDATSGIDRYEAAIDDKEPITIKSGDNLPKQFPGNHNLIIKAYDKAGNFRESKAELKIAAISFPGIKLFGFEIPFVYIICFLLLMLIIFLVLDYYLWGKVRRLEKRGVGAVGLAYGKISQMFSKAEKKIDQEIDSTIPESDLSKRVVREAKKGLKEKVHETISEEKKDISDQE